MKTIGRGMGLVPARFVRSSLALLCIAFWIGCSGPAEESASPSGGASKLESTSSAVTEPIAERPKPEAALSDLAGRNVLLITLDTLRWDYLASYGNKRVASPNLDRLAERGALFERAVAQVPLTLPSHASILSGAYPQVHGVRDIGGFVMDPKVPTIATIAQKGGIETAAFIGAAVLHRRFQLSLGFDVYNDDMSALSEEEKLPGVVAEIRANVVTDRAVDWLKKSVAKGIGQSPEKPFFLWAHYYDVHRPYDPPEPYKTQYADDLYAGETAYTDAEVGRLFDYLKKSGLEEKTLVIVMSDHGESLGEHGEYTHGVFLYESTMHIPLIIAGPGVPGGRRIEQQVRSIDIMPTAVEFMGLSPGDKVQGASLLPLLFRDEPVRTNVAYMETLYPMTHMGWSELRGVQTRDWKFLMAPEQELYNLEEDPAESTNVLKRFPAVAGGLEKQVWEVAGPPEKLGTLDYQPLDEESVRELAALGYVSAGIRRNLKIDMSGPDPKERTEVLKVMEEAGDLMNVGKFREASVVLARMLKVDETNPLIYQHLSLCYDRIGEYRKSLDINQQAVAHGADTDETFAEMGEIYIRFGQLRKAVEAMEKGAERNPTNLQNLVNLATAYIQLSEIHEAERVLKAILTQEDRHALAYNLMGILEIQKGNDGLARQNFERAVQLDPDLTEPYMNLGILAQEAGQTKQAVSFFEQFLARASPAEHKEVIGQVRAVVEELKRTQ